MARLSPHHVLLGLLAGTTAHGYHLLEHFQCPNRLGHIWKLSNSRVYTLLKQLERQGLIDGREEDAPDAPMRTVYWLTHAGRDQLHAWLHDPRPAASTRNIRTEFLSRLYIAQRLGLPLQPIIAAQQTSCQERLDRLQAQATSGVGALALRLQIDELRLIMDWLPTCARVFDDQTTIEPNRR